MRKVEHIMGLPISVDLRDGDTAAVDRAFEWLREVDARFSPFRPDSEVSRLDRAERGSGALDSGGADSGGLSPDLAHVLALCEHYRLATGGAFQVRRPGRGLDPCAVVKGWAVQRAADLLAAGGASRYVVNAGGDVVAAGGPWRVGVRHPVEADRFCVVLEVGEGAVATSGRYERGDHIVDGRTGEPVTDLVSLTVFAPSLTVADATATAAFAMGLDGIPWAAGQDGCEIYAVDASRRVYRTPGMPVAA
ncbi:FAD:protein FMN transferase [Actinosynnema sp. NPDC047251]|uniref:FAD:protein FMN transferase n=1 Tax=Saccharothrix espanaensis (strain ATCC 51144 / DSM 44229 / JCM 9112 / NBRC 15066 / NRRL 15764) TaxID=1179773 RepID=K0JQ90_SACES|nr:FAD:protein FMN transferase [Saccharothrix espanaensis]CCH27751.1 Thiamine biosynthesis lipoprotein precursor [Saccharothrix espanaensis DSM 44229]